MTSDRARGKAKDEAQDGMIDRHSGRYGGRATARSAAAGSAPGTGARRAWVLAALSVATLGLAACGDSETAAPTATASAGVPPADAGANPASAGPAGSPASAGAQPAAGAANDLVALAKATPDLSLLAEAVEAAGLAPTLAGPGPFTVFAPTNAAFVALLAELGLTKEALFADKPLLAAVLTYHALGARVEKGAVPLGKAIEPLSGGWFKVEADANGSLAITDGRNRRAAILATDVQASNGVVHVIDRVLLPPNRDIVATAQSIPDFSLLVEAVVAAGLADTLSGPGPFTVFAPTNAAFAALLSELHLTKDALFADKPLLTAVLTYHVLAGRVLKADVPIDAPIATVQGGRFTVDAHLAITDARHRRARITATDVAASNGVVHVIDKVLLPPQ